MKVRLNFPKDGVQEAINKLGYRRYSPFNKYKKLDIVVQPKEYSEGGMYGLIDMNDVDMYIDANGKVLPPNSGVHKVPVKKRKGEYIVTEIPLFRDGGTPSEIWTKRTGLPWSVARKMNLTDGTSEGNLDLIKRLSAGELDSIIKEAKTVIDEPTTKKENIGDVDFLIQDLETFDEAFRVARQNLGAGRLFKWRGRVYGTNLAGEKLEASEDDLSKYNMNTDFNKKHIKEENKKVESPLSSKEVVKVEPEWKDWKDVKKSQKEANKMSNADKIVSFEKDKNNRYVIVDKQNSRMHLYEGDKKLESYEVGTGMSTGDKQTETKIAFKNDAGERVFAKEALDSNGNLKKGYTSEVAWEEGNKQTGAGTYKISSVNKFKGAPSFTLENENGIEVPTVIHATLKEREKFFGNDNLEDNRMSYGCINGLCQDIENLASYGIGPGTNVYILPEDEGNSYQIVNQKLVFKSSDADVNRTTKTLNYIPIRTKVDFGKIALNDENSTIGQQARIQNYLKGIEDAKRDIMRLASIDGDVYNDIASISFGIFGAESDYAVTYGTTKNYMKGAARSISDSYGGPDYQFEMEDSYVPGGGSWATPSTFGKYKNRSLGVTQLRWSTLEDKEKKLLSDLGIYSIRDFSDPYKAAKGTTALLAYRYNNRSPKVDGVNTRINKDNIYDLLPSTWNNASNYSQRVQNNSAALSILQVDKETAKSVNERYEILDKFFEDRGTKPRFVASRKDFNDIGISSQAQSSQPSGGKLQESADVASAISQSILTPLQASEVINKKFEPKPIDLSLPSMAQSSGIDPFYRNYLSTSEKTRQQQRASHWFSPEQIEKREKAREQQAADEKTRQILREKQEGSRKSMATDNTTYILKQGGEFPRVNPNLNLNWNLENGGLSNYRVDSIVDLSEDRKKFLEGLGYKFEEI